MSEADEAVNRTMAGNALPTGALAIDPRVKPELIAPVFAKFGRVHIPGLFDRDSALAVYRALTTGVPWQAHYNDGATGYDIPAAAFDALPSAERDALVRPIHARAAHSFQYFFDNFSMADHYARSEFMELELMRVFEFLHSPAMLEFARRITGVREIATLDAQATRYRAGHFLTVHDDRDDDKGRVAAYILNMTPRWQADWGGILQFLDQDGHVAEGYVPAFNALNVVRVPAPHSVSFVAPFAGGSRLSITGWFRRF
jgi:hypothetical protein